MTAYDPQKFGRIDGKVLNISADAVGDRETGEQKYIVDVSLTGKLIRRHNGDEVKILPGMVAAIDVLSGKGLYLTTSGSLYLKPKVKLLENRFLFGTAIAIPGKRSFLHANLKSNRPTYSLNLDALKPLLSDDKGLMRKNLPNF
ncbi:MAG: hypothetical protein CM15mP54_27440 [Paracoccaceae bacterium]|nr:MAG: hypothetical protein CM15mP54_27440 [Paracoccaceae bacterium]